MLEYKIVEKLSLLLCKVRSFNTDTPMTRYQNFGRNIWKAQIRTIRFLIRLDIILPKLLL